MKLNKSVHLGYYTIICTLLFFIVSCGNDNTTLLISCSKDHKKIILISEKEAEKLALSELDWGSPQASSTVMRSLGPLIEFKEPKVISTEYGETIYTSSPIDLLIDFKENGFPINIDSLKIYAVKDSYRLSLLETLKPFIHDLVLDAKDIEIPVGKYIIVLELSDIKGNKTVNQYRLDVKD